MSEAAFFQFVSGLLWAKWQFNKRVYIYCSLGPRGQISGSPKERGPRRTLGLTVERERGSWSVAAVINEGSFLFEVCTFKVALIKVWFCLPPWKFAYRVAEVSTSKYIWIGKPVEPCCLEWRQEDLRAGGGREAAVGASSLCNSLPSFLADSYIRRLTRDGSVTNENIEITSYLCQLFLFWRVDPTVVFSFSSSLL